MKAFHAYKKISTLTLLCFLSLTGFCLRIAPITAETQDPNFSEKFTLENGGTRYIMTHLSDNETWSVNCTAYYTGKFYLFLFDERPIDEYIYRNGSLNPEITTEASTYNMTPAKVYSAEIEANVSSTTLTYTAHLRSYQEAQLFYIQIYCISGGPDAYYIISPDHEIQPYYIPFISAYPAWIFGLCCLVSIGVLTTKKKKQRG